MPKVMPSQVIQTIDELFSHAAKGLGGSVLMASHSSQLRGVLSLIEAVPSELINLPPEHYAELVLAISTIKEHLETWKLRGDVGGMAHVKGRDAITVIRRALVLCPDEYPPPSTTELLFIKDDDLRESIRRDVGAANRVLNNAEWKAATVLAGASIEALLHWRLNQPPPAFAEVQNSINKIIKAGTCTKPRDINNIDHWDLHHFIEVAADLNLIKSDTPSAARLAQHFRNLIHPGRAARLGKVCDRATAYSAIGALDHVIRDLTPV